MSKSDRMRWSGLSLLVAGVLLAIGALMHPDETVAGAIAQSNWATSHVVLFVSLILAIFGLTGLYCRVADSSGTMGLGAYVLTIVGSMMFSGIAMIEAWIAPAVHGMGAEGEAMMSMEGPIFGGQLGTVFMIAALSFALGYLLLGLTVWKDGALPQWAGLLLLGGVLMPFSPPLPSLAFQAGAILLAAGVSWIGWTMWSGGEAA